MPDHPPEQRTPTTIHSVFFGLSNASFARQPWSTTAVSPLATDREWVEKAVVPVRCRPALDWMSGALGDGPSEAHREAHGDPSEPVNASGHRVVKGQSLPSAEHLPS